MILAPGEIAVFKRKCRTCRYHHYRRCDEIELTELGVEVTTARFVTKSGECEMRRVFVSASGAHVEPVGWRHTQAIEPRSQRGGRKRPRLRKHAAEAVLSS